MNMENEQVYVEDPNVFQWQAREAWIKQRQKQLADELRLRYLQDQEPIPVSHQMVGGRYINSPLQIMNAGLSPGVRSERIAAIEKAIQQGEQEYSNADQRASIRHAQQRPGVVASGEDREGNPIVPPANPQDLITWAERGKHIPSRRELLEKLIQDQTIAEPLRAETRADRALNREDLQRAREAEKQANDKRIRDLALEAQIDRGENLAQDRVDRAYREKQDRELRRALIASKVNGDDDKPVKTTENERTNAGFRQRMQAVEPKLQAMEARGIGLPTALQELGSKVTGQTQRAWIETSEQQQYRNLAEDWLRAKLRKESGAVISEAEMEAEYGVYFPVSGDSKENIKQKAERRKYADEQLRIGAGNAIPKAGKVIDFKDWK